ncbi:hypothetical protein [Fusobacterium polymorphum]|uniref:hypothetical protein n=1 Tax=Fusobacterium nucleatum subsp. polymorphum TaxID=76857 RepID=UPI003008C654
MDFKTGKLHKIIKEFQKGSGNYEINGIDLKNTVFLYREKASPFIPIPKGNYRTVFNENESTLIVDEIINNKAVEFQVISIFDVQASKYLEKFPELKMLVEHTNKIVDDINNIIEYLNSVGIKSDSKFQTQILTPLEPSSTWYMNADGIIDTLPIDDFNKKFKEIIEKISETVDVKAREQVQEKLETLKTEIETFKNRKIIEMTDNIKTEKDTSLKAIEELLKTSKVELNEVAAIISNNSSEALRIISTQKDNSIREITEVKNNSKRELDSKMPEINNKLNGIAGGQVNPSFIQDVGEKRIGEYYLDKNTGKLFRCVRTTSNIINSSEYFKDMSIDSVVNRLENFSKLEGERLYVPNATFIKVYKIAGMVTLIVDSGTAFFNKANTPIFNIPEKYRPNETLYFSASYRNNTKSNTFFLYANGNLIKSEADDNLGAYYFTISYPAKN